MTMNWIVVLLIAGAFGSGLLAGFRSGIQAYPLIFHGDDIEDESFQTVKMDANEAEGDEKLGSFTVARTDRRPTWRERRRELEAAARTKRKRIEEWRD